MFDEREPDEMISVEALRDSAAHDSGAKALQPVRLVPKNQVTKDETALEFLRDLVGRVERGEADLSEGFAIHYLSSGGPGNAAGCTHHYWRHGMGMFSHLGLLAIATRDIIQKESSV